MYLLISHFRIYVDTLGTNDSRGIFCHKSPIEKLSLRLVIGANVSFNVVIYQRNILNFLFCILFLIIYILLKIMNYTYNLYF